MSKEERAEELRAYFTDVGDATNYLDTLLASVETDEAAAIYDLLAQTVKGLNMVLDSYRNRLADDFKKLGVKKASMTGLDGLRYSVEVSNRPTRTDIQRDDLIRHVERLANNPELRTDPMTGEVSSPDETRVRLLKTAFRLDPRWAEIGKLGLNDDEFCRKTWSASVKIEKEIGL